MEYTHRLNQYPAGPTKQDIQAEVETAIQAASRNHCVELHTTSSRCIDPTALNVTDSTSTIRTFTQKTMEFHDHYPDIPNVASICVYPNFVETVGLEIGDGKMAITSVAGGFPSSQTYLEVKMLEIAMAVENGADEIDIVMNVGQMLTGEYELVANEIEMIRKELGDETILKVIIESGALQQPELIRKASLLSMLAGADFVKTSTGKIPIAATPEAAVAICHAIRDYYEKTGRQVGFKAAGGVKTPQDAALYYTIVETILGPAWLTPALFRIGASSAANNLLSAITGQTVQYY